MYHFHLFCPAYCHSITYATYPCASKFFILDFFWQCKHLVKCSVLKLYPSVLSSREVHDIHKDIHSERKHMNISHGSDFVKVFTKKPQKNIRVKDD